MANEYTSQASELQRVTNLRRLAGSADGGGTDLNRSFEEMGRRVELEFDRIFSLMRSMDSAIATGIANTLTTASGDTLWELDDDGNIVPKDQT